MIKADNYVDFTAVWFYFRERKHTRRASRLGRMGGNAMLGVVRYFYSAMFSYVFPRFLLVFHNTHRLRICFYKINTIGILAQINLIRQFIIVP